MFRISGSFFRLAFSVLVKPVMPVRMLIKKYICSYLSHFWKHFKSNRSWKRKICGRIEQQLFESFESAVSQKRQEKKLAEQLNAAASFFALFWLSAPHDRNSLKLFFYTWKHEYLPGNIFIRFLKPLHMLAELNYTSFCSKWLCNFRKLPFYPILSSDAAWIEKL